MTDAGDNKNSGSLESWTDWNDIFLSKDNKKIFNPETILDLEKLKKLPLPANYRELFRQMIPTLQQGNVEAADFWNYLNYRAKTLVLHGIVLIGVITQFQMFDPRMFNPEEEAKPELEIKLLTYMPELYRSLLDEFDADVVSAISFDSNQTANYVRKYIMPPELADTADSIAVPLRDLGKFAAFATMNNTGDDELGTNSNTKPIRDKIFETALDRRTGKKIKPDVRAMALSMFGLGDVQDIEQRFTTAIRSLDKQEQQALKWLSNVRFPPKLVTPLISSLRAILRHCDQILVSC
jgi:hypothetical protein